MGLVLLVGLYGLCGFTWWALGAEDRAKFTPFQIGTLVFVGLLVLVVYWAVVRCRITADDDGIVVVNGYRSHHLAWTQVVAVSMPSGAPWAVFDLDDGTTLSGLGIQASDGHRARVAIDELRALVESRAAA